MGPPFLLTLSRLSPTPPNIVLLVLFSLSRLSVAILAQAMWAQGTDRPDPGEEMLVALQRRGGVVAAAAAKLTRKSHLRNNAGRRVYRRFRRDVAVDMSDPPSSAALTRARRARVTRCVPQSPFRRGAWRVSDIFTCNLLCYREIFAVIAALQFTSRYAA